MPDYFRWVDAQRSKKGRRVVDRGTKGVKLESLYNIRQPFSNRLRAGATYCSACNSIFQGLLADILKRAGWYLFKACYLSPETMQAYRIPMSDSTLTSEAEYFALLEQSRSLYGCRPVNEIHDQFLIEAPEERGDAAATATGLLMNRAGAEILPDVPVKCEPILARRWSKRAEEKRADGKLIAWEDPRL
jgi:DNA polymerase-1